MSDIPLEGVEDEESPIEDEEITREPPKYQLGDEVAYEISAMSPQKVLLVGTRVGVVVSASLHYKFGKFVYIYGIADDIEHQNNLDTKYEDSLVLFVEDGPDLDEEEDEEVLDPEPDP